MTKRQYWLPRLRNLGREVAAFVLAMLCFALSFWLSTRSADPLDVQISLLLGFLLLIGQGRGWVFRHEPEPTVDDEGVVRWYHADGRMTTDISTLVRSKTFRRHLSSVQRIFKRQRLRNK